MGRCLGKGHGAPSGEKKSHRCKLPFAPFPSYLEKEQGNKLSVAALSEKTAHTSCCCTQNLSQKIQEAVLQDPKLFNQVLMVSEAVATDAASIAPVMDGVFIDPEDAAANATAYRTGL